MADTRKGAERTAQGKSKAADISDASPKSSLVAGSESGASSNLSLNTPATTPNGSKKTLPSVDSTTLNLKAGLVAGAYSDFQNTPGARLTVWQIVHKLPSGRTQAAILSIMSVDDRDLELVALESFLDFAVVPLGTIKADNTNTETK